MKMLLNWLKGVFGEQILAILIAKLLTKNNIVSAVDAILDMAENLALKTPTKLDDKALLQIREALNIPDNDK